MPADADNAMSPFQIYAGYTGADLHVLDRSECGAFMPSPGFVTDFFGVRTRTGFIAGLTSLKILNDL